MLNKIIRDKIIMPNEYCYEKTQIAGNTLVIKLKLL